MFDPDSKSALENMPKDPKLNPYKLVEQWSDYITEPELQGIADPDRQGWSEVSIPPFLTTPTDSDESEILMPSPAVLTRIGDRQPATWPKDEWKKGPRCWIRIYHKQRRALFLPTGTKDGPDIATLSGSRMTKIMYLGGSKGKTVPMNG